MSLKFKALILVLALAVLPLRGIAAVAMWCCAQNQETEVTADHADHADHGGARHAHEETASHGADHSAHHDKDPGDHHSAKSAPACGGCVTGCAGAVVASSAWTSLSFSPPGTCRIPFLEHRFTGIVPAQLERPPLLPTA